MESAFHSAQHTTSLPLHGLIPATVVPMTTAGEVDLVELRRYLSWIADQGPVALAVTADTGEVAQLSHAEQLQVVEAATQVTGLPCIAGLTASSTARAVDRANDLRQAGAAALLVFPTPAFLGARDQVALDYHRAIGEAGLPLIVFQLQPSLGGVLHRPGPLRRLLELDAVVAIKEASFDRDRFQESAAVVAEVGNVTLLTGNDTFILESLALGAEGALLGFGAVMTHAQVTMVDAWRAGRVEEAQAWSARLQPLADAIFAAPIGDYRSRLKEVLVMLGVLAGAHVRAPLLAIGDEDRSRLRRVVGAATTTDMAVTA